jgi:hypothetical protein
MKVMNAKVRRWLALAVTFATGLALLGLQALELNKVLFGSITLGVVMGLGQLFLTWNIWKKNAIS